MTRRRCDNFRYSESIIELHLYRGVPHRDVPIQVLADTFYMAKKKALRSPDSLLSCCHQILKRWRGGER